MALTLTAIGVPGTTGGILMPKLSNRWKIDFIGLAGSGTAVTVQAVTVSRPQIELEEVQLDRYNSRIYVAGKHTWSDLTMTIEDDMTGTASAAIQAQMDKQLSLLSGSYTLNAKPTGSGYKFAAQLSMLDGAMNAVNVIEKWNYEGCWIKSIEYGELDYSSSEAVKINLTIRFDHASQDLTGGGSITQDSGATK